ncbi:hypothetical protein [Pseudonocardia sp.]|uniref:hypothetical protein n=1 Tax=Pseudonocardia sp. TaxID=60912 RepID=UPI002632F1BA|nr:hypothetical protein [Pseudonocardia sp.]
MNDSSGRPVPDRFDDVDAGQLGCSWTVVRILLRRRFGHDARLDSVAARLAVLPDEERVARILAAASLDDLAQ